MQSEETEKPKPRDRRQLGRCEKLYRNTCILYLRSDPTLFNKFMEDLDNVCIALGILQALVIETDVWISTMRHFHSNCSLCIILNKTNYSKLFDPPPSPTVNVTKDMNPF